MRINQKIIIVFSMVIVCTISSVSYVSFRSLESAVIDSQLEGMKHEVEIKANLIESLHARATEDILFTVKNPVFVKYYELPETRAGDRYDENGVMQFTATQRAAKAELEQWIDNFQSKFHVDETCLVDHLGQEHARLVLNEIASDGNLSPSETQSPFFAASFQTPEGKVYIQSPYVSPDTKRWVFAYTTPIVLSDGSKPAFYHFEMPMQLFQDLVDIDVGRMYVVDRNGLVYADSEVDYENNVGSVPFGTLPKDFFENVADNEDNSGIGSPELFNILQSASALTSGDKGTGSFVADNGEEHYVAYQKLPTFGWILVQEKPYSLMLAGNTNLSQLGTQIVLVSTVIGSTSLAAVFMISSRIAGPIASLASALRSQEIGNLKKVNVKGSSDEVSDVTDAVNNMITEINSLEKQKDEFASMITHELRTPLTPVLGWCQVLKNPKMTGGVLNTRQEEAVDIIRKSAKRLEGLISDMLDAQKLDMKKMRFNTYEVVAHEIVASIMQGFQGAMRPKNIQFVDTSEQIVDKSGDGDGDDGLAVKCDRSRVEQVLSNLVVNAIDFVPASGGRIEVGVRAQESEVIFYVKDNGIGIPADKQKGLFTKFYQVDTSLTRKHGGSGLGLAICKGIVESHGGRIWVESEEGRGATFLFTLPRLESDAGLQKERSIESK
ncbi:MAG TPA: sensor histidine kinase [Nitrososphaera sp.]|nr:sensor histidine kinase [Nitrososphaera sp.]